jgi:hypothetical protein
VATNSRLHPTLLSAVSRLSRRVRVRGTLRLAVCRQSIRLGEKPLETHDQYFFQLNTCGHGPYVTSPLTRRWVFRLQFLLGLASAVILRSESCWTHDNILLSQIRDSPNLEGQVPVFISSRNRVAQLCPLALGSLFVTSTTRRATVEVSEPASTRKVEVILRLTVSQSVNLGVEPQMVYYTLTVMVLFFWGDHSDERTGLSFLYAAGPRQRSLSRVRAPWDS